MKLKTKHYILVFVFFFLSEMYSQNFNDLEYKFNNTKGKPKIELANKLIEFYLNVNKEKALYFAQQVLIISNDLADNELVMDAYYNLGNIYYNFDHKSQFAIDNYKKALEISVLLKNHDKNVVLNNLIGVIYQNKDLYFKSIDYFKNAEIISLHYNMLSDQASIFNNIAISYKNIGDLEKSIVYYLKSLKIMTQNKDYLSQKSLFNNIGNVYFQLGNLSKALEFYENALKISDKKEINNEKAKILNNLAIVNHKLGNLDKSMTYYNQSIAMKIKIDDKSSLSTSYLNLGSLFLEKKDYTNSLIQFNKALELSKLLNNSQVVANTYYKIGDFYLKENNLFDAKKNIDSAYKLSKKINNKYLIKDLYESYSDYYFLKGNIKKCLQYKDKYILAKDSIYNIDNNLKLNGMFQRFALEEKDRELESSKKEQRISYLETENQKVYSYSLTAVLLLLSLIVLIVINRYNHTKKLEKNLEVQNEILVQTQGELKILLAEQQSLSDSRSRLLTTIAHDFKTPLTAIATAVSIVNDAFRVNDIKVFKRSEQIVNKSIIGLIKQLDEAVFIVRNNHNKDIFVPQYIDFIEFLNGLIEEQLIVNNGKHKIILKSELKTLDIHFDKAALNRIITNLLTNAIKYSPNNSEIVIKVLDLGDNLKFSIKDSGIGIPKEEQKYLFESFHRFSNVGTILGTGLGLSIVKRVIDFVNGSIEIESDTNQGTEFIIVIPKIIMEETY